MIRLFSHWSITLRAFLHICSVAADVYTRYGGAAVCPGPRHRREGGGGGDGKPCGP
jgi:hypothetical protein